MRWTSSSGVRRKGVSVRLIGTFVGVRSVAFGKNPPGFGLAGCSLVTRAIPGGGGAYLDCWTGERTGGTKCLRETTQSGDRSRRVSSDVKGWGLLRIVLILISLVVLIVAFLGLPSLIKYGEFLAKVAG